MVSFPFPIKIDANHLFIHWSYSHLLVLKHVYFIIKLFNIIDTFRKADSTLRFLSQVNYMEFPMECVHMVAIVIYQL